MGSSYKSYLAAAMNRLSESGYRLTRPRKNVLELLYQSKTALSPTTIHKTLSSHSKALDLVSVYRILDVFNQLGIVHRDLQGRYRACNELGCPGLHLMCHCRQCGRGEEKHLSLPMGNKIRRILSQNLRFRVSDHVLNIEGYCQRCQK